MKVVCRVMSGQLLLLGADKIVLEQLAPYAQRFYQHKPRMIKYRSEGVTLLVFTSLRFRLMGGGENHMRVLHEFLQRLPWNLFVSDINVSTMTVTHHLGMRVNLHKLDARHFSSELELFPASVWLHGIGRENVNIFHTGRIVITGVRSINKVETHLLPRLLPLLSHALYR